MVKNIKPTKKISYHLYFFLKCSVRVCLKDHRRNWYQDWPLQIGNWEQGVGSRFIAMFFNFFIV